MSRDSLNGTDGHYEAEFGGTKRTETAMTSVPDYRPAFFTIKYLFSKFHSDFHIFTFIKTKRLIETDIKAANQWAKCKKMKIFKITGTIDRRILINYQVEKEVVEKFLPKPFRPKLVNDKAVVGICLIRLKHIRPKGFPKLIGISSENAAHRIAVEWTDGSGENSGVYIPRRDTSSKMNSLAGGRIFPGVHHFADFTVDERDGNFAVKFESDDNTFLSIKARETEDWNENSVFSDLRCASCFFEQGAVGYSPDTNGGSFDGLELKTYRWEVSSLKVNEVHSSFFENEDIFPQGSVKFDNALLMKNIEHEWTSLSPIKLN